MSRAGAAVSVKPCSDSLSRLMKSEFSFVSGHRLLINGNV